MLTHISGPVALVFTRFPVLSWFSTIIISIGLCIFALGEVLKPAGKRKGLSGQSPKLPPGPPGVFLFGTLPYFKNIFGDPRSQWLRDIRQYGEMATVHAGSKTWIFLNSNRVVDELINKRSSYTNTRSPMPVSGGIVSKNRRSLLLSEGPWKERRRVMHGVLSGSQMKQYGEWQVQESTQMMAEYVFKPEQWYKHHSRYANSVVHRVALGERLLKSTAHLSDLQSVTTRFVHSVGRCIVDWFPEMDAIPKPLQWWRPQWEELGDWTYGVFKVWWDPVREQIRNGTAPPSWARDSLFGPDSKFHGDEDDTMYLAMSLIAAGSDTTREALNIMTMAFLTHPEPFKKARAQIDAVCGVGADARLPVLEDMEDLTYICAMAKEVLRWRPIFKITPEHTASKDIDFEGYHFPAGVSFVINEVAVSLDHEDGETFNPDRWMNGHETDIAHGLHAFGGGRRICVGYRLAQRSLFLNIARLVQCVDLQAYGPIDPFELNHEEVTEPFPVKATMRSDEYRDLIVNQAAREGVLEDAKVIRENL